MAAEPEAEHEDEAMESEGEADIAAPKALEKAQLKKEPTNTIYIGHLPYGFFEKEITEYFSQFGKVVNVRVSRNKKTGNSKGYAFCQFENTAVAQKAARVMHKYLIMGRLLDVHIVDELHPEIWKGANKPFVVAPTRQSARIAHNKVRTEDEMAKLNRRRENKKEKAKAKVQLCLRM
eukprot:JZ553049.1.p2 GENE.JZ553049.1~~JZ553049.1.p2  ORF type:complete len:201 (+),score=40.89 JZ553049.1:75-605(+)